MSKEPTLLCIDDDPSVLKVLANYFTRKGFKVFPAENGKIGLELYHSLQPDIVLVDLKMPGMDGFQVLQTVQADSPDTPIIVISGEGERADVIQALRLGAWDFHIKSIDNFAFIEHSVQQALDKARLIRENKAYQHGLEKKLFTVIENFDGFIITIDQNFHITYMNPALITHLGHDATGENCHKALFGFDGRCQWCRPDQLLYGQSLKQEIQNPQDDRWYYAVHSPVLNESGQVTEIQVILTDITERKKTELELREREEYLRKENIRLRSSLADRYKFGSLVGKSKPMLEVYETIINAAASDAGVIIYGETGTGKELVAREIHQNSDRKKRGIIYVNCGAIPENLIESEFFGYKKGAFTGAIKDKHGFLDLADGGTLFLDEVGEIPLNVQVKLLRALEGGGYVPVGGTEVKKPDIRIIAATHRDLKKAVKQGLMRQDFLYRIHIIPIHLPALRARKEDIPLLVEHFLKEYDSDKVPPITAEIHRALQSYDWPGNVRELQNTINRLVTLKKLDFLGLDLAEHPLGDRAAGLEIDYQGKSLAAILKELEKKVLLKILAQGDWHQGKVSELLQIDRKTLYRKLKQFGIDRVSLN
ncbi:MAG: sigma 54-interacting transcriptional regulator [Proteobacteria bacterium]|nr:sigma 54-interacting transcriptional regulator [Pseudomonadota bacterium]MBU4297644.1 sigma 54-interacting transcriptional regulator [Pseudomonadota bacterium]MCG2749994.1 sigma 54-interacting transcriptional regulator [Desulfobulbaceae bacterium]